MAVLAALALVQEQPPEPKIESKFLKSLRIEGRIRVRGEWREPATYLTTVADPRRSTDAVLQRTRLSVAGTVNDRLGFLVEIQDSRIWGEEPSPAADTEGVDLKQGFLEGRGLFEAPLTIRAGRFEVPELGDQRLISPLDWSNVGRSLDGLLATYEPEGWRLTAMTAITREATGTGDADDDFTLSVLYVSRRLSGRLELDACLIHRGLSDRLFSGELGGPLGDRRDWTVGLRSAFRAGSLEATVEAVRQIGDQAGDDISAWAAAAIAGVAFEGAGKPYLGLEYSVASGDRRPADGEVETFDPILPFGHSYYGHMDLVGWRNVRSFKLMGRVKVSPAVSVHADLHWFRLTESRDAWYDASGSPVRRDPTGASGRRLGREVDVYVRGTMGERLFFWIGLSGFRPSGFVEDTGFDATGKWVFLQAELKF